MKTLRILLALLLLTMMLVGCTNAPTVEAASGSAPDAPVEAVDATSEEVSAEDDDWAYIQSKGKLIVGITIYEPMNYYDESNTLVGFDTEFTEALCALIGVEPEFVIIDWDSKELELASKNIDCIWNGLTVTEERKANMAFTDSYLYNCQMIVVPADKAAEYTELSAFAGKTVVAEEGSAGASAIEADMPDAEFIGVSGQTDALLEVKAGTADAAVVDKTLATAMVGEGTDYADLVALEIPMAEEEYAIGLRVGSSAVSVFNEAIKTLYADGTMAALAEKYNQSSLLIAG